MKKTASSKKSRSTEGKSKSNENGRVPQKSSSIAAGSQRDWRADTLARVRDLITQADPDAIEEVKWRKPSNAMAGVPVWSHDGIICTGETYKDKVKLTFARGASLDDPSGLFNSSLDAGTRRAIDLREADKLNEKAFKALIRAAAALNTSAATDRSAKPSTRPSRSRKPKAV